MKRRLVKKLAPILTLLMVISIVPLQPVAASAETNSNVEITLSVGETDLDVSNFVYDVQKAVYEVYGITSDRVKITKAGASIVDSKNDFNWTIYDHYYSPDYPADGSEPVDWAVYHSINQPYFYYLEDDPQDGSKYFTDVSFADDSLSYCNKRLKHIYPKDDGIIFAGYSVPAYKDFMVYPDQNSGEKTIEFTIDESGVSTHTLEGAGFLFNASISDNQINGYLVFYNYLNSSIDLYKLTNVDAEAFHNEEDYDISSLQITGIELIASKDWYSSETVKNIRVQVTNSSLKFYEENVAVFDTTGEDSEILIEDTGAGGFGPLVSYRSHWCSELSYFTFKNLTMETYRPVSFLDIINQQTWSENSKRIIINVDDDGVPEFSDSESLSQIVAHMRNYDVNYIGWGQNNELGVEEAVYNKEQAEQFIAQIGGKGMFINSDDPDYSTYEQGIAAIAEYINKCLTSSERPPRRSSGGGSAPVEQKPVITFPDLLNHWGKNDIEKFATAKLVDGYPDGTFRPDNSVTRAEFAAMLAKVFSFAKLEPTATESVYFSDVSSSDWYYEAVSLLAPEGIIKGYGDGTFGPNKLITREEASAMIAQMLAKFDVELQDSELTFSDNDEISFWAKGPLGKIVSLNIVTGMPDGTFQPAKNSTRAEAVVMLLRMLERQQLL